VAAPKEGGEINLALCKKEEAPEVVFNILPATRYGKAHHSVTRGDSKKSFKIEEGKNKPD